MSKSHRDRFVALLAEFGITPEITVEEHYGGEWVDKNEFGQNMYTKRAGGQRAECVTIAGGDDRVGGRRGFECVFAFDAAGKFLEAGIWE